MENEYCCEAMQTVLETWDGPFGWFWFIDPETHDFKSDRLAVRLYNLTPSKKGISRKGRSTLFLSYCPICGKNLEERTC